MAPKPRYALRHNGTHSNIWSAVAQPRISIPDVLDRLEKFYGAQEPGFPVEPFEFLIWWHCGYPASDTACQKGWKYLKEQVGIKPEQLLAASPAKVAAALKAGAWFLSCAPNASKK